MMTSSVPIATQLPLDRNPLGMASAIISFVALALCVVACVAGVFLRSDRVALSNRIATNEYESGDLRPATDRIGIGVLYLAQLTVYGIGVLVGGTLSLIGFSLGLASILRQHNRMAIIGVFASPIGPLIIIACIYFL